MMRKRRRTDKLSIDLKFMGCPYDSDDPRAAIWLAGFRACLKQEIEELAA